MEIEDGGVSGWLIAFLAGGGCLLLLLLLLALVWLLVRRSNRPR